MIIQLEDLKVDTPKYKVITGHPAYGMKFRIHPDYSLKCYVLTVNGNKDYLLKNDLGEYLRGFVPRLSVVTLYQGISKQGEHLLVKVTDPWNNDMSWKDSILSAVNEAKKCWVERINSENRSVFEFNSIKEDLSDPTWPDCSFEEIVASGFNNKMIGDIDHIVVRKAISGFEKYP